MEKGVDLGNWSYLYTRSQKEQKLLQSLINSYMEGGVCYTKNVYYRLQIIIFIFFNKGHNILLYKIF